MNLEEPGSSINSATDTLNVSHAEKKEVNTNKGMGRRGSVYIFSSLRSKLLHL